jgi:glycosyltransferase 2 family protein
LNYKKIALRLAQAVLLFILCYYLVYRNLVQNWNKLSGYSWDLQWWPFLGSLIVVSAVFMANSLIWRHTVIVIGGVRVRPFRAAYIWFVSNLGRYLPGRVWQIAGMAVMGRQDGISAVDSAASAVVSQVVHLLAGCSVGLVFLPAELAGRYGWMLKWAWLGLPPLLVLLYPPLLNRILALASRLTGRPEVRCRLRLRDLLLWYFLNLMVWLAYGVCFYYFVISVVPEASLTVAASIGIYAVGYIIGFLILFTPGGLGVRELLFTGLLAASVGDVRATVVALVSRVWLTLAELIPLAVLLIIGGLPDIRPPDESGGR